MIPAIGISLVHVVTLIAVTTVAVGAIVFKLDVGMLAVIAAVALHLLFPSSSKGASNKVSWGVVLLICGVVTYMALLQRMGTITTVGRYQAINLFPGNYEVSIVKKGLASEFAAYK